MAGASSQLRFFINWWQYRYASVPSRLFLSERTIEHLVAEHDHLVMNYRFFFWKPRIEDAIDEAYEHGVLTFCGIPIFLCGSHSPITQKWLIEMGMLNV